MLGLEVVLHTDDQLAPDRKFDRWGRYVNLIWIAVLDASSHSSLEIFYKTINRLLWKRRDWICDLRGLQFMMADRHKRLKENVGVVRHYTFWRGLWSSLMSILLGSMQ